VNEPLVRIGELARRVGVPPATLRAWERRYGILKPDRTESGYRLYSGEDERRLRAMLELITRGQAPAEAAAGVLGGGATVAPEPQTTAAQPLADELLERLTAFDGAGAHRAIDRAVDAYSVEGLIERIVLPVLQRTGELWAEGELSIAQEHFTSHLLRGRLLAIGRAGETGEGPLALLACPPGEEHDLGLLCFALILRERGWRTTFLGANVPLETITETSARLQPRAVVLAVTAPEVAAALAEEQPPDTSAPLYLAGASASAELAERLGAETLDSGLLAGARRLAGD
jgi:methanogenic corrinoid protein MtbC1